MDPLECLAKKWEAHNYTSDSPFFRVMHPYFFVKREGDKYFIAGNDGTYSDVTVVDIYDPTCVDLAKSVVNLTDQNFVRSSFVKNIRQLSDPGLCVTRILASDYAHLNPITVCGKLGDIFSVGGKIYPDISSKIWGDCWYLTVPAGKLIPVEIQFGNSFLADLGVLLNHVMGGKYHISLRDFFDEDEPKKRFRTDLIEKSNNQNSTCRLSSHLNFLIDGVCLDLKEVESPQEITDLTINASVAYILMSYPNINQINLFGKKIDSQNHLNDISKKYGANVIF